MDEIIKILLLLFDAFLIDLCEAQLSHHELPPLLPRVALGLRAHRQGLTPLQLIAGVIKVVHSSLECGYALVMIRVILFGVISLHAPDGGLGHLPIDDLPSVDPAAACPSLGGADGEFRVELV